jgi:hypothetical protein
MYLILKSHAIRPTKEVEIPTEIFLKIAEYLPKSDLLSLRQVSRDLYEFSSNLKFFEEFRLFPSIKCIDNFRGVCNHSFLREHVKTISVFDTTVFKRTWWTFSAMREVMPLSGLTL